MTKIGCERMLMVDGDGVNTGASGAIPRDDIKRMDVHAERYYEEIRHRKSDVEAVARNTGFSAEDVQKIKEHIFVNAHSLAGGVRRFDPLYDIAVSWQRLIDGKDIQEMDLVLLRHEKYEYELMTLRGLDYGEAHELAETQYNYARYVKELDEKE